MTLSLFHRFRYLAPIFVLVFSIALHPVAAWAQGKAQSQLPARTATVQGHVRDSVGKPVANAKVSLQSSTGAATETWNTRTDSAGAFRFVGPWTGSYMVRTGEPGSSLTIVKAVELKAGETAKVDLTLETASAPDDSSLAAKAPALFDEPQFTVAGVTPATNSGGHGSDTVLRNSEALVRETASLGRGEKTTNAANPAADGVLLQEGAEIQAEILRQENAGSGQAASGIAGEEKSEGDAGIDKPTRQKRSELYHRLAQIDEKLGNPLQAVQEYERAEELAPSETNLFDWASELLTHRALVPASEVFARGNTLYPQSVRMLIGLGVVWYARGSNEKAAQYLASASDLAPADPAPYLFMGSMQSSESVISAGTLERLARFARLEPNNALANYYYAVGLWKSKEGAVDGAGNEASAKEIEKLLETAARLDPKLGAAQMQLGMLYAQRGDYVGAVAAYQKAIEVSPELEEAHYRLALAYKKTGDEAGAAKELKLHEELAKQGEERAERERGEIQEFVVKLRDR